MRTVRDWLTSIGLAQYAEAFETNEISMDLLGQVDDQMLKDMGVSVGGHRLRIRNATAKLNAAPPPEKDASVATGSFDAPASSAERRQLTVMFCDLAGSTTLSTKLDPEDLRNVINAYHRCCAEAVERKGGFVAKYMGDGVLAYFGYPRADEHDAEQAVRAGLALVDAVPKLVTAAGAPLRVRVGVATGLVVVGDLIGTGAAQEQSVVGETPNLAARLQGLAEPGTLVIAATTRQLTGGLFEYRDLGPVALKGFADGTPAWQVLGTSAAESRFEALRAATTPLVGREEEIGLLLRRWEQAKRGDGQVVLISGEPGIGKSRIAQTIVERIAAEPHTRLRYFCSPHHQDSALYPSIAQLERAAGFRRDDTAEQRLAKLEAVLSQATDDLSEAVPLLADLLAIPTGDRYPRLNLTPQKQKEKTLRALMGQVEGLSARQPVLMVFEDVHWADPTSRESLDLLIERVATLRVLAILTFRPEFTPPWIGRPHVTFAALNRLPLRQRAEMIVHVTGGKALPRAIADQIAERTDGVPLFIEELTKTVVESGIVTEGMAAPLAIPTSLHASLLARLDRLAPTREIAQIGAALGRFFSHELISAVAPMPQQQTDDALAQLVGAELILRRGNPPDAEYTFKHALVQDTAYSTLLRSRRLQLHARIADTLERRFPEIAAIQPQIMAQHFSQAGLPRKAAAYWLQAGRQAAARGAMSEAVAQLQNGLANIAEIADDPERQKLEFDLQVAVGSALMATRGFAAPEPGGAFARAHQLCAELDLREQMAWVLLGEFHFRGVRGELKLGELHAAQLRQLSETLPDPMWRCIASERSGVMSCYLGKFTEARRHFEHALSVWDPEFRGRIGFPEDVYIHILLYLFWTLLALGYLDQARQLRDRAADEARHLTPFNLAEALSHGWLGYFTVEGAQSARTVLTFANEVLAAASEHGFPHWLGVGQMMRGWSIHAMGQQEDGIRQFQEGLAVYRATGAMLALTIDLTGLAWLYAAAGRSQTSLDRLAEAMTVVETTQECVFEAEVRRLRGVVLLAMGEGRAAERSFLEALAVARQQNAKYWELRSAIDLARLWGSHGKRREAHDLLAPVFGWFTEGFDTPVLQDAKALLGELAR